MNDLHRKGEVARTTKETHVLARVEIDGEGRTRIKTTIPFLDHMLVTLATHSLINMEVEASGDLAHHITEDVAITLGEAISRGLGNREGISRFGSALVPMDEALVLASVDLARRPFSSIDLRIRSPSVEGLRSEDVTHFLTSLAASLEANLHVRAQYGENDHHNIEAAFKALALSLRQACKIDERRVGPPSAKGAI